MAEHNCRVVECLPRACCGNLTGRILLQVAGRRIEQEDAWIKKGKVEETGFINTLGGLLLTLYANAKKVMVVAWTKDDADGNS